MQDMKKRSASGMGYSNKKGKDGKKIDPQMEEEVRYCPKHKEKVKLNLKQGRYGPFYSCSQWKRDKSGCNYKEKV